MLRAHRGWFACRLALAIVGILFVAQPSAERQLLPSPAALARAPADLIDRLRADPFTYFRFINRAWTERVCEAFADRPELPIVRLHGDAHVEQFALTKNAWGLDDFDDSARGPAVVDIVRYLGSIDLATRQRGWTRDRDRLWDRFLEGYRRGLSDPDDPAPVPGIVARLRKQAPLTPAAYLAWGDSLVQPLEDTQLKSVIEGMTEFERAVRRERPDLVPGYFTVVHAGWLRIGVGSAGTRKVLIRVQGPTADPDDDQLIEAKEVANLDGVSCLEPPNAPEAVRVIDGTRQLGRLKHDILAVGPALLVPAAADRAEHWWISSWEASYREVRLSDLQSVEDLGDIAFDSGVQLGAGKQVAIRREALSSVVILEQRIRKETSTIVEELLAGWREFARR
jgi:hypothetical protein